MPRGKLPPDTDPRTVGCHVGGKATAELALWSGALPPEECLRRLAKEGKRPLKSVLGMCAKLMGTPMGPIPE